MAKEEFSCSPITSETGEFEEGRREYLRPPPPTTNPSHPWLLIHHGKRGQRQTFYSLHENRYYTKIVPQMHNKNIYPTNIGEWLVLEDQDTLECRLWNIVSFDNIEIPSLGDDETHNFLLTSPPQGEQDCHIVLITEDDTIRFCKLGDKEFQQSKFQCHDGHPLSYITTFKGVIYLLAGCVLFEVKISATSPPQVTRLTWKQKFSDLLLEWIEGFDFYLIGSEDDLLLVIGLKSIASSLKIIGFSVFRMNFSHGIWERVKDIGEKTLFLSPAISLACTPSNPGVKKNSIYYVRPGARSLYIFNLGNQSTSVSVPCPIVSRHSSYFLWVMF